MEKNQRPNRPKHNTYSHCRRAVSMLVFEQQIDANKKSNRRK